MSMFLGMAWNAVRRTHVKVFFAPAGKDAPELFEKARSNDAPVKLAYNKTKSAFESGKLFEDRDMKNLDQLSITYVATVLI